MRTLHSVLFAAALSAAACTGSAQMTTTTEGGAYVQPSLVEVEPGVQVVADYDQPVFYSDNAYWRYDGGIWYQSRYHDRGWVRVETPPERVRHIQRPEMYVHYHAGANVHEQHAEGPEVRDHRTEVAPPPAPAPEVRDHRDEHADVHVNGDVHANEHADVHANEHADVHANDHAAMRDEKAEQHDAKAEAHARVEMKHDEKAEAKDRKEVQKDEKARAKDERKEQRDERKH